MERLIILGMLVIFAGVFIVTAGILGSIVREKGTGTETEIRGGGVIFIGPVPIVFGTDRTMVFISIAGALLFLAAYYVWRKG